MNNVFWLRRVHVTKGTYGPLPYVCVPNAIKEDRFERASVDPFQSESPFNDNHRERERERIKHYTRASANNLDAIDTILFSQFKTRRHKKAPTQGRMDAISRITSRL